MVVSMLPHAEFGRNDHREDAAHFIIFKNIDQMNLVPNEFGSISTDTFSTNKLCSNNIPRMCGPRKSIWYGLKALQI